MCICVFEIQLGTGRPHKCVRACVCLSLGQVARTLARACLSPGTGAHICARAGLRLRLGQVARRKNNVCVCVELGTGRPNLARAHVFEPGDRSHRYVCVGFSLRLGQVTRICVYEVGTGRTHVVCMGVCMYV